MSATLATCVNHAPERAELPDAAACRAVESAPVDDARYQFVRAAKAIAPSVVSVVALGMSDDAWDLDGERPLFLEHQGYHDDVLARGQGSGVIVDAAGYVLTNHHVVDGASELHVVLHNGHEYNARWVGGDAESDLAVIKVVPGEDRLQAAVLGDSKTLQVGEWVLAAGSPFGLRQTVSVGIVSALGRQDVGLSEVEDFIQTDAALNPGNSGGPLVDMDGRVVGIQSAIATLTGSSSGIGFAIPISLAQQVMRQLIEHGKVERAYAGVYATDMTLSEARELGLAGDAGARVVDLAPDSPAEQAGLRVGDVITGYDTEAAVHAAALRNRVANAAPGAELRLKVWRDGQLREVTLTLGPLPSLVETDHDVPVGVPDLSPEDAPAGAAPPPR
ncbi:MAG: trypsin-like peptidase domain-containing protein [Polyangiales bacterium]